MLFRSFATIYLTIFCLIASCVMLSSCGIRPSSLQPPEPSGESFPRQYPQENTR